MKELDGPEAGGLGPQAFVSEILGLLLQRAERSQDTVTGNSPSRSSLIFILLLLLLFCCNQKPAKKQL